MHKDAAHCKQGQLQLPIVRSIQLPVVRSMSSIRAGGGEHKFIAMPPVFNIVVGVHQCLRHFSYIGNGERGLRLL